MQNPYVHYAGDGLGPRDVFVNGNPIRHVVYANQLRSRCGLSAMAKFIPANSTVQ